jgi:hypothetical protein
LDISPSKPGRMVRGGTTMQMLRSMVEMGLLVGTAVAVLLLATLVL